MKFVSGTNERDGSSALSKCVHAILCASGACIATAFLGDGADEFVKDDARVICDIGMGGTNPKVLRKLSAQLGDNLRFRSDFHPKVYISGAGAFTGSANLSNNGVGFLADSGALIEAGIYLDVWDELTSSLRAWFEEQWLVARVVGPIEIAEAERLWKSRARLTPPTGSGSFFSELAKVDGNYRNCGIFFSHGRFTKKQLNEISVQTEIFEDKFEHLGEEMRDYEVYDGLHSQEKFQPTFVYSFWREGVVFYIQKYIFMFDTSRLGSAGDFGRNYSFYKKMPSPTDDGPVIRKKNFLSPQKYSAFIRAMKEEKGNFDGRVLEPRMFLKILKEYIANA